MLLSQLCSSIIYCHALPPCCYPYTHVHPLTLSILRQSTVHSLWTLLPGKHSCGNLCTPSAGHNQDAKYTAWSLNLAQIHIIGSSTGCCFTVVKTIVHHCKDESDGWSTVIYEHLLPQNPGPEDAVLIPIKGPYTQSVVPLQFYRPPQPDILPVSDNAP